MKDNFDLRKFLAENKTVYKYRASGPEMSDVAKRLAYHSKFGEYGKYWFLQDDYLSDFYLNLAIEDTKQAYRNLIDTMKKKGKAPVASTIDGSGKKIWNPFTVEELEKELAALDQYEIKKIAVTKKTL